MIDIIQSFEIPDLHMGRNITGGIFKRLRPGPANIPKQSPRHNLFRNSPARKSDQPKAAVGRRSEDNFRLPQGLKGRRNVVAPQIRNITADQYGGAQRRCRKRRRHSLTNVTLALVKPPNAIRPESRACDKCCGRHREVA